MKKELIVDLTNVHKDDIEELKKYLDENCWSVRIRTIKVDYLNSWERGDE